MFPEKYKRDWKRWMRLYRGTSVLESTIAPEFGRVLRRWQAVRPLPMRRPKSEASHAAPYLEDLLAKALPHLEVVGHLSVRYINSASQEQLGSLFELWDIFRNLAAKGKASCVGVSKAVLLLTEGRLGPALDSTVRDRLGIQQPFSGEAWVKSLGYICDDISAFEQQHQLRLESLVPTEWAPVEIGRAYDMVAGPR